MNQQNGLNLSSEPYLDIIEQPQERGYRYRYKSEGATHGGILGASSKGERKTYPAVEIKNYRGHATLTAQLVSDNDPPRLHPHSLTGKNCENGVCTVSCGPSDMVAQFPNLGIERVTKKNSEETLFIRYLNSEAEQLRILPEHLPEQKKTELRQKARREADSCSLTAVRIMFIAYLHLEDGQQHILPAILSDTILDCKATNLCQLKISRISKTSGSAIGNDEIWIFCEKVQKDDINIRFFEEKNGQEVWFKHGEFFPTDVHKQVGIVFRSPPYDNLNITSPVEVQIQLQRRSDQECSNPKKYTYMPIERQQVSVNNAEMKAFSGFPYFGVPKPEKKKGFYKAPNPQKMPIDPSQLSNMSRGAKKRKVEDQTNFVPVVVDDMLSGFTPLPSAYQTVNNFTTQMIMKPDVTSPNFPASFMDSGSPFQYSSMTNQQQQQQFTSSMNNLVQRNASMQSTASTSAVTSVSQNYGNMNTIASTIDMSGIQDIHGSPNNKSGNSEQPKNFTDDNTDLINMLYSPDIQTDSIPGVVAANQDEEEDGDDDDDDDDDGMFPVMTSSAKRPPVAAENVSKVNNDLKSLKIQPTTISEEETVPLQTYQPSASDTLTIEEVAAELQGDKTRKEFVLSMQQNKQGLLHKAVSAGRRDLVEKIIQLGYGKVEMQDSKGFTPLHMACFNNKPDIVQTLLEYCDSSIGYDFNGFDPIHISTAVEAKQCIKLLQLFGVNINKGDGKEGNSPLHMAVKAKNIEMAKFLIEECDANVESRNYNEYTPLHLSASRDDLEMTNYLLSRGAKKDSECSEARDPSKNKSITDEGYGCIPVDFARSSAMKKLLAVEEPVSGVSIDDSLDHLDPLMRHQFCCILNKTESESDRLKLAEACNVDTVAMVKKKNQTDFVLSNYKGTISSLRNILTNINRKDLLEYLETD